MIKLHDKLRHKKTGRTGEYVEHLNVGEGYMVRADDNQFPPIICGYYDDFEKVEI